MNSEKDPGVAPLPTTHRIKYNHFFFFILMVRIP